MSMRNWESTHYYDYDVDAELQETTNHYDDDVVDEELRSSPGLRCHGNGRIFESDLVRLLDCELGPRMDRRLKTPLLFAAERIGVHSTRFKYVVYDLQLLCKTLTRDRDRQVLQCQDTMSRCNRNRYCKLDISTAPTKAKSREPAYSQDLIQNKIDKQRVRFRETGRQAGKLSSQASCPRTTL